MAQVVLRCLAREPAERFQRAHDLAVAFRQAVQDLDGDQTQVLTGAQVGRRTRSTGVLTMHNALNDDAADARMALDPIRLSAGRTIAVLPLQNQGPPDDEDLADGLTQELIDSVAAVKGVRVFSRGAVQRWAHCDVAAADVGRELGAALVVAGTMRRIGTQLRIAIRVVDTASGQIVANEQRDCEASGVLQASDALGAAVAQHLTLERATGARPLATHEDSAVQYLRARALYGRSDVRSVAESAQLFERVLAQAPGEPKVLMNYALAHSRLWFFGYPSSADRARGAAERAVAVSPDRAEAWQALASVHFQGGDAPATILALQRDPHILQRREVRKHR